MDRRHFIQTAGVAAAAAPQVLSGQRKVFRVGFIGLGRRGRGLLATALENPDCEVVALCDLHGPNLEKAKQQAPNAKVYEDFRDLIAAPDIDATVYAQRFAPVALGIADRVTLYCAADDRALKLSRQVHGGYDRLGSCREDSLDSLQHPRLEVVDASQLYVDLIDHDKVAGSPRLLSDLRQVLVGAPIHADERGLVPQGPRYELPP